MAKEKIKEENREFDVPEYYSFNGESYNFKNETYRYNKEDNDKVSEENKSGKEDNINKSSVSSQEKKFENIQKATNTSTTAIKTVIVTASSVAIVIGGVMIFNETVLPPSHVEIMELYAYENNVSFGVFASDYETWEEYEEHLDVDGFEECDIEIELYGGGETLSMHMHELGMFYDEFTGLKYDTEYELCVYQNITFGLERPLLASKKIRTEPKEAIVADRPYISEIYFEKYTYSNEEEVVLSFSFEVSDPNSYYTDYQFEIYEQGRTDETAGEAYIERGDENSNAYYGSVILSTLIGESFTYKLNAMSTYPEDLSHDEATRYTIFENDLYLYDLQEMNNQEGNISEFYSAIFSKETIDEATQSLTYLAVTLYYSDPNSYWSSFTIYVYQDDQLLYEGGLYQGPETKEILDGFDITYISGYLHVIIECYSTNPDDSDLENNMLTLYNEEVDLDSL